VPSDFKAQYVAIARPLCPHLRISSLSCGLAHCLLLEDSGQLWGLGSNHFGQLGLGHCIDTSLPVPVGGFSSCSSVACGAAFSLVVCNGGVVFSCGSNEHLQLGRQVIDASAGGGADNAPIPSIQFEPTFRPLSIALGPGGSWTGARESACSVRAPQVCSLVQLVLLSVARVSISTFFEGVFCCCWVESWVSRSAFQVGPSDLNRTVPCMRAWSTLAWIHLHVQGKQLCYRVGMERTRYIVFPRYINLSASLCCSAVCDVSRCCAL
jgi:hypothetical protein